MTCLGCGKSDLREILDLGVMALAGGFLASLDDLDHEPRFPLRIHCCGACGLVQTLDAVDQEMLFRHYAFSSSTVGPLVTHFTEYARWVQRRMEPALIVEFGCNDGILLQAFQRQGMHAVGVDLSDNISEMAREKGCTVYTGYFDLAMAQRIRDEIGQVDVVTGSNAFAHNAHPDVILIAARHLLNPTGYLCLEMLYAGDILDRLQWDSLYHEHVATYSLTALRTLLSRYGFALIDVERTPLHGGSIRVTASPSALRSPSVEVLRMLETERMAKINTLARWTEFGQAALRKIQIVGDVMDMLARRRSIWAYGAAGKATMWMNACHMDYLGAVVDSSPLRAGKYMPGTHTPIVFPEELREAGAADYLFISAWNYAALIRGKESWYPGVWCWPMPDLQFC